MLDKVITYIEENELIQKKDRIVVGVSGGADSVCLFSVLLELQKKYELELFVVHVHHGIRGEEADKDEQFVENLAKKHQIPYYCFWKNIPVLSKKRGLTEEEAGRIVRYEAFYEVLKKVNATKIAVAHNQNDCAETVLFQLFRGSGLKGMCGILPKRDEIIRPLLGVDRKAIEAYLMQKGQAYCTDRTNLEEEYTRNKIRLSILPIAEEINEKSVEHIAKTAQLFQEVEAYLRRNVEKAAKEIVSEKNGQYFMKLEGLLLQDIVIQKEVIKLILIKAAGQAKDIEARHIEKVLSLAKNQSGKKVNLPYQMIVRREYEYLVFGKEANEKMKELEKKDIFCELIPDRTYKIEEAGLDICLSLEKSDGKWQEIIQNTCMKWFDYDKIENGIQLRTRKNGDFFQVNAEGGTKKLKDYFIDKKIPRQERDEKILLADGSHIIWILGDRISEKYKVTETTKNVLKIIITEVKKDGR